MYNKSCNNVEEKQKLYLNLQNMYGKGCVWNVEEKQKLYLNISYLIS